ncbi:hypothetical protein MKEN_01029200 [Mycena kentingensis (nom. inval.)]|nr:hypothetical protein MKEN_01029200 [Mycena kentingensis (nom. inval.)]
MSSLARAKLTTNLRLGTTRRVVQRWAHTHAGEYRNIPFDYSNRRNFAIKCLSYMGFGFALPFVAVGWQWYKPGGFKNP